MGVQTRRVVLTGLLVAVLAVPMGVRAVVDASPTAPTEDAASAGGPKRTPAERDGTQAPNVESVPEDVASQTFVAITPFRAYDSRLEPYLWQRDDDFNIDMLTDAGGAAKLPPNATAITYNLTVTSTVTSFGYLSLFPGDAASIPDTSSINWALPDFTIANGGVVALGQSGQALGTIGIYLGGVPGAAAHVIVDVTGYYVP